MFRRLRRGDSLTTQRLTGQSVALIVKRRAADAGTREEQLATLSRPLAPRRLRHTAAAAAGVEERKIANVTRHRNLPVLRSCIRAATTFDDVGKVL